MHTRRSLAHNQRREGWEQLKIMLSLYTPRRTSRRRRRRRTTIIARRRIRNKEVKKRSSNI